MDKIDKMDEIGVVSVSSTDTETLSNIESVQFGVGHRSVGWAC